MELIYKDINGISIYERVARVAVHGPAQLVSYYNAALYFRGIFETEFLAFVFLSITKYSTLVQVVISSHLVKVSFFIQSIFNLNRTLPMFSSK